MFTKKYAPKYLKDIKGQELSIKKLKYNVQNKIPTIIYGETGTGKTSSVYALANELNYEILELNASNFLGKDNIESIIGNAAFQQSLFKKGKIILIDELEGISGKSDRGGLQALIKLLPGIPATIILITNDIWNQKFSILRKKFDLIEFKKPSVEIIFSILEEVVKKENIKYSESDLKFISRASRGDIRAALTDLQISIYNNELDTTLLSERDKTTEIFNALRLIFKTSDPKLALSSLDNLKENLDDVFLWLEENLPREYREESLSRAFYNLSKADVFKGRIIRQQYYRFMVYQIAFLTVGVALSKIEKNTGFVNYSRPSRILKMYISKMRNTHKLALSKTLAEKTHTSTKKIMQNFAIYKSILKNPEVISELKLAEEEIRFLKN